MGRINASRMVVGGLLAGLVINIGEYLLNQPILGDEMAAMMAEMGLEPVSGGAIAVFVVLAFLMGIVAVWIYAAIRPRYGAGPLTAIRAGLAAWFFGYVGPMLGSHMMGMTDAGMTTLLLAWGLVELPLATVIGAWAYTEEAEAAPAAAPAAAAPAVPAGGAGDGGGSGGGGGDYEF